MIARTVSCFFVAAATLQLPAYAQKAPKAGDAAPQFEAPLDSGTPFSLAERKGQGWTVLYFYPKADTPGCTKQACAFRDRIQTIRKEGAEVYGVSTDSVADLQAFRKKYNLNFPLISDKDAKIATLFGAKMPLKDMAKRWTFVIDSDLKVRWINNDVDPAKDVDVVATKIRDLKLAR